MNTIAIILIILIIFLLFFSLINQNTMTENFLVNYQEQDVCKWLGRGTECVSPNNNCYHVYKSQMFPNGIADRRVGDDCIGASDLKCNDLGNNCNASNLINLS